MGRSYILRFYRADLKKIGPFRMKRPCREEATPDMGYQVLYGDRLSAIPNFGKI